MSLDLNTATARIARQLRDAEQATDQAIIKSAELMATLVKARADSGVVVHTGQRALIRLVRAQQALVDGSSGIFRVHDEMAGIGKTLGIFDEPNSTPPSKLVAADLDSRAA